eukprot:GILJ01004819.1.p1 GENE.GILJ01004819.1~~GILJ01004819.1.p1  ORF type:complete len:171 (-),score=20.11 GILJ01004819.1:382-894(-)
MQEIVPNLFLGSDNDASQSDLLRSSNIRFILNCAPSDCKTYFPEQFEYAEVPWEDVIYQDITEDVKKVVQEIDSHVKNDKAVLVHCLMGVSRSSSVVLAYLMLTRGFSLLDAFYFTRERRNIILPNLGFMRQLIALEEKVSGKPSVDYYKYEDWFLRDVDTIPRPDLVVS